MNEHTCGRCGHPLAPLPEPGPSPSEYRFVYVGPTGAKTTHVVQGDNTSALCGVGAVEGKRPTPIDQRYGPACMACALALRKLGLGTDEFGRTVRAADALPGPERFNLGPLTEGADRPPHD